MYLEKLEQNSQVIDFSCMSYDAGSIPRVILSIFYASHGAVKFSLFLHRTSLVDRYCLLYF